VNSASITGQVGDLAPDFLQMVEGDDLDLAAGVVAAVHQTQKPADLVQGETQGPAPTHEGQAHELRLAVLPVAAFGARRLGQESDALVIADRLDVASGGLGQGPDG
jgi:hypothetical protein